MNGNCFVNKDDLRLKKADLRISATIPQKLRALAPPGAPKATHTHNPYQNGISPSISWHANTQVSPQPCTELMQSNVPALQLS